MTQWLQCTSLDGKAIWVNFGLAKKMAVSDERGGCTIVHFDGEALKLKEDAGSLLVRLSGPSGPAR